MVERELLLASRGKAAYRWRTSVVGLGLAVMAILSASLTAQGAAASSMGQAMFAGLTALASLYAFVAGATVTADTVSREKREGTLGLLFLTDLRGIDVVLGKLAASSINTLYGLMGLAPLLAIPVMLGGVTIVAGVLATLSVLNLLFVCLAIGLAVSSVSWDERRAAFAALITCVSILFLPFLGVWFLGILSLRPTVLLCAISPIAPVVASLVPTDIADAARGLLGTWGPIQLTPTLIPLLLLVPSHVLGWVLLLVAGRLAGGVWQSRRAAPVRRTFDEVVFTPRRPETRAVARRRLLEVHPLVWLLERHPGKRFYADGLVIAILFIWANGYRSYGTDMFGGPTWFLIVPIAVLIHLVFAAWVVAEASIRWIQDRRSGALELLLCSGLSDATIVGGYRLVLRRLFLRAILLLAGAEVFVAFYGFADFADEGAMNGRWMLLALAAALILDTHGLSWIALRLAANIATVNRVGASALAIVPGMPLGLTILTLTAWTSTFGAGQPLPFRAGLAVWIVWVALVNLVFGGWFCRRWVLRELRSSASRIHPKAEVASA